MSVVNLSDSLKYIGVFDGTIDLFESQYLVPDGVTYNSYVLLDDKVAIMDTVDRRAVDAWLLNLEEALAGRLPDYLVVQHMEPDHSASILRVAEKYPSMKIVASGKAFLMMEQFFDGKIENERITVKEGDTLTLGSHQLHFVMAPMVHWPEVMVSYESKEKILFAADGFGSFGPFELQEDWSLEARRYFINIVGKYGPQVQALLKKASDLDIAKICPLHGPVLQENLGMYLEKYDIWSSYRPEEKGIVIAYGSIHGNTRRTVEALVDLLKAAGEENIHVYDLARDDMSAAIADAFRYDRLVVASVTYDASLFPCVQDFLYHLKIKNYQKRTVGLIENGSWAPMAGKKMREMLEGCRELSILEPMVTVKSALGDESREKLRELAKALQ